MPLRIKSRLCDIGKTQVDLIFELEKLGYNVAPSELSLAITGVRKTPKAKTLVAESDKIIRKWERRK